ncbi:gamma-glutamylcyclotransferase family protein [Halalkalibacter okhensis]|uniref:Gamma-glutamylcyclotransferase family protein n=1 Tax=Halalkalibacter okhensis TaxID=333138 RepID=A0A0B0IL97_9BACI|nr:gamma-glutamylcyclotransferase family protein [Halalkalibacter okhensis]KHF40416.1 hypothetical protein LQ50_09070 [Halalkalibacter okhensis]
MSTQTYLVFVYGTLRKGGSNNHYLKKAKLISLTAWLYGELHDTGYGYPVLKEHSHRTVTGELYEVTSDELVKLDQLEDYVADRSSNEYERVKKTVYTDEGEQEVFVYMAGEKLVNCSKIIEENDWMLYMKR